MLCVFAVRTLGSGKVSIVFVVGMITVGLRKGKVLVLLGTKRAGLSSSLELFSWSSCLSSSDLSPIPSSPRLLLCLCPIVCCGGVDSVSEWGVLITE